MSRKNRSRIALTPVAFHDSSTFLDETLVSRGALPTALPKVPPAGVRRLEGLEYIRALDTAPEEQYWRRLIPGYGAEPHASLIRRQKPRWATSLATSQKTHSPLQAKRRLIGWQSFRELHVPQPKRQAFCISRLTRKQVLFAKQIAGHRKRSPGAGGHYKRTYLSSYTCR